MSDHISFNLAKEGFNVAKYMPYGPIESVLPYLSRRAQENSSVKAKKDEVVATGKSEYSYRITEKATRLADKNVYVLNVPKTTNKTELKKVLQAKYKVTVLGINIVNSPKKMKAYKGRMGQRGGGKKAYITLASGQSIVL